MESRWLKARNNYRKLLTLAVVAILLVLTIFSPVTSEAAELTATVKKYGNNWAVIYNPGEIYLAFEEVAKAELVAINTTNGTSYVVKVRDNAGRDLPVTYTEARSYMQSKGYWQGEDLSKIQIQKQTNQWWIIYPTTGQKVAFESVAKISLTFEITDNHGNKLPVTYGEALPYMQSKGYWKTDTNESHEEEEKGFWATVTGFLSDIWDGIKDIVTSLGIFVEALLTGQLWSLLFTTIINLIGDNVGDICMKIISLADGTEDLFKTDVAQILVGFSKLFGFMLWIIGFIIATAELVINHKSNRLISDSLRDYAMNTFKSFLGVTYFTIVPVPLYMLISKLAVKICNVLINTGEVGTNFNEIQFDFLPSDLLWLIFLIAVLFSGLKVLFSFIKRGGVLMILILVGSVHMINIPRGYWDAFWSWCRQIIALCITQFCQMALFCAGLSVILSGVMVSFSTFIAGLSMMLAAAEVPRIAERYGMDTSLKGNAAGAVQTVAMAARMIITKGA